MNCGHVCVKSGWLCCLMAFSVTVLWLLYRKDSDLAQCTWKEILKECFWFCVAGVVFLDGRIKEEPLCIQACYAGIFGYLIIVSVMDLQLQMISDFLHGIGLLSGAVLAFCRQSEPEIWWGYLMFCLIQYFVFGRMYGAADVAVFLVCALFFAAGGRVMETYLCHMLLTFVLLGGIQFLRKNITKSGNLKEPVPLVPYIAISFFVII